MLVLNRSDVESLLDLDELRDAVAGAMAELSAGNASMPNRIAALVPEHSFLAVMPAYLPSAGALTTKLVSVFPENRDRPTHQAVVVCFDPDTGIPIALMDAESITAERTAAGSALSAKLLAREDARVLAILGTGVQARAHARAVVRVRPIERVVIAGRDPAKARALATELAQELAPEVDVAASFEDAVRAADIVCATTHTTEPVVRRDWVSAGMHITSVGFNSAGRGEIDPETVAAAFVVVEHRDSSLAPPPAGAVELLLPIADGLFDAGHIQAELGELVAGSAPALGIRRRSRSRCTSRWAWPSRMRRRQASCLPEPAARVSAPMSRSDRVARRRRWVGCEGDRRGVNLPRAPTPAPSPTRRIHPEPRPMGTTRCG